jgi:DNA end-binding protein Ku
MDKLIKTRTKDWSPELATDPVQAELLSIIKAKQKGRKPANAAPRQASEGNVISIMDALKKSLEPRRK